MPTPCGTAEGKTVTPTSRAWPDGLASRIHRGQRVGHAWEGFPGTWEIPTPPWRKPRNRRAERKRAKWGRREVGAPQYEQ